jgi:hypothetical protein
MSDQPYSSIVAHYEQCLRNHGTGAPAVDWKSAHDAALRYDVMLEMIRDPGRASTLLDFGCGLWFCTPRKFVVQKLWASH